MANILKEFRRKRRRKKLLAERAKLEQAQMADMAVNEDDYQKRLARHRHAAIRKVLITVVVIVAAVTAVFFYLEKRSYKSYQILQTSEQEDIVSTSYQVMAGKILRYSPDGASLVNDEMEAYWSVLYEMENPVADINRNWAVIADVDGTTMEISIKTERREASPPPTTS